MKVVYPVIGLAGETGEVAEKVKKTIRDNGADFDQERTAEIVKELGDVLWYVANIAADLGTTLEEVAARNIEKLRSRADRDRLHGSGDNR